jgi:hypothetical protein
VIRHWPNLADRPKKIGEKKIQHQTDLWVEFEEGESQASRDEMR